MGSVRRVWVGLALMVLLVGGQRIDAQDATETVIPAATPTVVPTVISPLPLSLPDSRCGVTAQTASQVELTCEPGYATARDKVTIIAPSIDPNWVYPTTPNEPLPELLNGYWIFDVNADGSPNLIVQFSQGANGEAIADFYTDLNGNGQIDLISARNDELLISEPSPIQLVAPDGWWTRGDLTNFNLDMSVDGKIAGSFSISLVYGTQYWDAVTTDGKPEFLIHVRDLDRDGRPDYEWRQIELDAPEETGYRRTEINYNTQDDEGAIEIFLFWRFLGVFTGEYVKLVYGESVPPIQVNWQTGQVGMISEFVSSRTNAGNFFVYSTYRLDDNPSEPSIADFEAPFAFYNVTGIQPVVPDLLIRTAYNPPQSVYFVDGDTDPETTNSSALEELIYAWRYPVEQDTSQGPIWDYNLSIGGRHEYTGVVSIPPLLFIIPPYAELPNWVINNPWDVASLSANEGANLRDTEAGPRWNVIEGIIPLASLYLMGSITESPFASRFTNVEAGMRVEMVPALQQQLWLYIDSLDGKLHLQKTQFGMWRVNALSLLNYRNLNDDAYIDQWSYTEGGRVRQQLTRAGNFILLQVGTTLRVAYVPLPPSLHEMLPPVTGAELLALHEAVQTTGIEFAPNDLAARFELFDVPTWDITEMALSNLSLVDDGFEAVLQLTSDSETGGTLPIEVASELGELVTLRGQGDRLTLEPLEPPLIVIDAINVGLDPEVRLLYDRQRVEIRLRNESLIDIEDVQVRVNARQGSTLISLLDSPIDLPSRTNTPTGIVWEPSNTGEWQIEVNVDVTWNEETVTLRQSQNVIISPENNQSSSYLDLWGQLPLSGVLQLALLFGGMLIVLCLFVLIYRRMIRP